MDVIHVLRTRCLHGHLDCEPVNEPWHKVQYRLPTTRCIGEEPRYLTGLWARFTEGNVGCIAAQHIQDDLLDHPHRPVRWGQIANSGCAWVLVQAPTREASAGQEQAHREQAWELSETGTQAPDGLYHGLVGKCTVP